MKTKRIIEIELALLFIIILIGVLTGDIVTFDKAVYQNIISVRSDLFDFFMKGITKFGNTIPILIILSLLMIKLPKKERYILGIDIATIVGTNQIIKYIVQRARPDHIKLIKQGGYSFPSGHAMISIALYGFLIYYIYHHVNNKYWKVFLITILVLLIIGIGCSRIYIGVHYPSDVLAGYSLALLLLLIIIEECQKRVRGK